MSRSAWAWTYSRGLSGSLALADDEDARRRWYGIEAVKAQLVVLGWGSEINLGTGRFGGRAANAAKGFQDSVRLEPDGKVGPLTANALFHALYARVEQDQGIPRQLLRAHCHWESADDPGAELVNSDGSRDRGLTQANDQHDGELLTDALAFDPGSAVPIRGRSIAGYARAFGDLAVAVLDPEGNQRAYDEWDVAVAAHRTPVGARELAVEEDVVQAMRRQDGGTWEQAAAYYCWKVNTGGRAGWVT